ncbi:hypothetical protein [Croceimicrobium sp.]|uniref:hypothetical protein n=1 Tax=Croceimicrobium sp. TaxID=2828340 RepID=UPI003BAA988C
MPQTIKKLLFHIFFLSILSIEGFMLFQTLDRAHLDNELNSLNGPLVESWTFIHQTGPNENGYYNQDSILAFQIFGHHQTFGISENRAFYHDFKSYLEQSPS